MKIAILTDSYSPYVSGVTTYTVELTKQLIKNGHTVQIFVPDYLEDNITPKGLEKANVIRMRSVPTIIQNCRICIPNTAKVIRELKNFKAEIIEIEDPLFLGLDGLIASKILGIPCVSVFHTLATSKDYLKVIFKTDSDLLQKAAWIYHQKFYDSSDKVFVFTQNVFKLLIKKGINKEKINIISTFFDYYNVKILNKSEKKALKKYYRLNEKVAIYLGRVSPEKNLNTLMKIWKDAVKQYPNSTLLIIGSGIYEKELKRYVQKEKLENNVKLLGLIEHEQLLSSGLLSICDIFVSASKSETFGLTGIEAMAHKLVPVLFKTQGLSEVVDSAAILCKPNDTKEFKKAIITLFEDEKLRQKMGKKARKIAGSYNSESVVKDLIKKYKVIISDFKPSKVSIKNLKKITKIDKRLERYKRILNSLQENMKI